MSNNIERDEFDLWAESSEETVRKESELGSLKFLHDLDRWINESFVDDEVQAMRGMADE
jgi:hypothetical protein